LKSCVNACKDVPQIGEQREKVGRIDDIVVVDVRSAAGCVSRSRRCAFVDALAHAREQGLQVGLIDVAIAVDVACERRGAKGGWACL